MSQDLADKFVGACHGDAGRARTLLREDPTMVAAVAPWGETPIQAAAQTANIEIAEMLLASGTDLDICTAAVFGRAQDVERMLAEDASRVHATGAHGVPLLCYPVIAGDLTLAAPQ